MLSLICNRASICKQSGKALMGISTEFYSDKIDIHFIDVNAKSLWPFSTFVNQVLKFYPHFACSERLRKFPIKYGDLYICGRGVRKLPVQYWHRNHCCIWFSAILLPTFWTNRIPRNIYVSLPISITDSRFCDMPTMKVQIIPLNLISTLIVRWLYSIMDLPTNKRWSLWLICRT